MDESQAIQEEAAGATPIFGVYRRGYDPEQVDRYVVEQQHRLDEALHRASESERKLAAAVGQLRELHRRVAVYESEARNAQPPQLDTLGERVQRILQEAWEGAYTLRQEAEREVTELREQTSAEVDAMRTQARADVEELREVASKEAADVVDEATRRALHIRDETERRRQAYLERVERDREQAIAQITYLYDQRQGAIAELARLQATVQATVEEMVRSPLGRPAPGVMEAAVDGAKAARLAGGRPRPQGSGTGSGAPGVGGPGVVGASGAGSALGGLGGAGSAVGGPGVGVDSGVGSAVGGPDVGGPGAGGPGGAGLGGAGPSDRTAPKEPFAPAAEAAQLPGVLGVPSTSAGDPDEGPDMPTGPMERFVRPSDRAAARAAAQRGPDAEADAMERFMRKGVPNAPVPGGASGSKAGGPGPDLAAPRQTAPAGGRPVGESTGGTPEADPDRGTPAPEVDTHASRGPVLGGLIRPRRQPKARAVFDVEQDG
jgi:hypothetical protein